MNRKFPKIKRSALFTYRPARRTARNDDQTDPTTTMITTTVSHVLIGL